MKCARPSALAVSLVMSAACATTQMIQRNHFMLPISFIGMEYEHVAKSGIGIILLLIADICYFMNKFKRLWYECDNIFAAVPT